MTNEEIIAVIKAKEEGKIIEFMPKDDPDMGWTIVTRPIWNFEKYNYRVQGREYSGAYSLTTITKVVNGNCVKDEDVCNYLTGRKVIASDCFWDLWNRPDELDVVTLDKIHLYREDNGFEFPFCTSDGACYEYIRLVIEE